MIYGSRLQWNHFKLYLIADETALIGLGFKEPVGVVWEDNEILLMCKRQLEDYFNGNLRIFDVPIRFAGTEFQQLVWTRLREIPYGRTMSYGEVAAAIDRPGAARAVGMACNRNPLAIIVPCHRVIGKNHNLTGYAGGLELKRMLIEMEEMA